MWVHCCIELCQLTCCQLNELICNADVNIKHNIVSRKTMPRISVSRESWIKVESCILKSMMHRCQPSDSHFSHLSNSSLCSIKHISREVVAKNYILYHFVMASLPKDISLFGGRSDNPAKLCMLRLSTFEIYPGIICWDTFYGIFIDQS